MTHVDPERVLSADLYLGLIDPPPLRSPQRRFEQGFFLGRPSEILVKLKVSESGIEAVKVGGSAVKVAEGKPPFNPRSRPSEGLWGYA